MLETIIELLMGQSKAYILPILIVAVITLGFYLLLSNTNLKAENQMVNMELLETIEELQVQNKMEKKRDEVLPTDIDGIAKRMRETEL